MIRHLALFALVLAVGLWGYTRLDASPPPTVHAIWAQIEGSNGLGPAQSGVMPLNLSLRFILPETPACPAFQLAVTRPGTGETTVTPVWTRRTNMPQSGFDVTVCQTTMHPEWQRARLLAADGTTAVMIDAAPPSKTPVQPTPAEVAGAAAIAAASGPLKMAVFGDTGCRGINPNSGPRYQQQCDPRISDANTRFRFGELARQAMTDDPDFVMHLGDYRYDKEYQKDWANWNSDFFSRVAQGPLKQVPWAFTRGNHESCNRAGHGWYFFFGPGTGSIACSGSDPRLIKSWYFDVTDGNAPPHRFIFVGTSPTIYQPSDHEEDLSDAARNIPAADRTPAQFAALAATSLWDAEVSEFTTALDWAQASGSAWLVMHKPLWGLDTQHARPRRVDKKVGAAFEEAVVKSTHRQCTDDYDPTACGLKAVLAAHEHLMTNIAYHKAALPQQYVIGMSGVRLDSAPGRTDAQGMQASACRHSMSSLGMTSYATAVAAEFRARNSGSTGDDAFGYVLFTRDAGLHPGWSGVAKYVDGKSQKLSTAADIMDPSQYPRCDRN